MCISEKRQKPGRRKKAFSNSPRISHRKADPLVRLRGHGDRGAVLAEIDALEKLVGFAAADCEGGLLGQVDLKTKGRSPVLQNAGVIPIQSLAGDGTKIDEFASFRTPKVSAKGIRLPDVNAIDKAEFGAEIRRE